MFPEILREGIWHTTSIERYRGISASGAILPEPPIPDKDRWGTAGGPDLYPFVRSLGGVSVFDFANFEPLTYGEKYPLSHWATFVPCYDKWTEAIWIELDRLAIKDNYIDGHSLVERWRQKKEFGRKIMPIIEAAHIGPIPTTAFRRIYKFTKDIREFVLIA